MNTNNEQKPNFQYKPEGSSVQGTEVLVYGSKDNLVEFVYCPDKDYYYLNIFDKCLCFVDLVFMDPAEWFERVGFTVEEMRHICDLMGVVYREYETVRQLWDCLWRDMLGQAKKKGLPLPDQNRNNN